MDDARTRGKGAGGRDRTWRAWATAAAASGDTGDAAAEALSRALRPADWGSARSKSAASRDGRSPMVERALLAGVRVGGGA